MAIINNLSRVSFWCRNYNFLTSKQLLCRSLQSVQIEGIRKDEYATTVRDHFFEKTKEYRETKIAEPSKLLMVWRIKKLVGRPYWEKNKMRELGLDGERHAIAIVKNTPANSKTLMAVKHLVRIKPITFPNGLPKDADYTGTFLKLTGEFIVSPKLEVDTHRLLEDPDKSKIKMDGDTLEKELRRQWHI